MTQSSLTPLLIDSIELVNQMVVPTIVLDLDGRVVVWNKACERLTGVSAEAAIGTHDHWRTFFAEPHSCLADLVTADESGRAQPPCDHIQNFLKTGAGLRAEHWCDMPFLGTRCYVVADACPLYDGEGKIVAVVETLADHTDRKRIEETLRLTSNAFENALEGIVITDLEGSILHANKAFLEMSGYTFEEVRGKHPRLLQSGNRNKASYAEMWNSIATSGFWRGEIWNKKKDGQIYPETLTISAVKDQTGVVTHYIGKYSDISDLKKTQQQLESITNYDALTGLPNRGPLSDRLRVALASAKRRNKTIGVCFLDIDHFKPINDKYGHEIGNRFLVAVAQRLRAMLRETDTVARIGGDEFVILLDDINDVAEIRTALDRVLEKISHAYMIDGHEITTSASIGVTFYPGDDADPDALLRHADQSMYRAKQLGRNRYVIFDSETEAQGNVRQQEIERIRQALESEEFVLFYQPKVKMRTGEIIGAEALIRWMHPEKGMQGPMTFLPQIEKTPLTIDLGKWVMRRALRQIREWQEQGVTLKVSVNISANHIQDPNFVSDVREALAQFSDVSPTLIELEILESSAFDDIDQMHKVITECQTLGVTFALDDFGTGYSTLTYLKRLPSNILKIDQSFVRNMINSKQDMAIIKGVVGLASAFGMDVIAEGVETDEHGVILLGMGCELAQGFGVARPMPPEKMIGWISEFRPSEQWANSGNLIS